MGHTAARKDTFIFNGIIYFLTRPSPPRTDHEHVSAVTYYCFLLSIHVEAVFRKSDQVLLFTEVRLNGVLTL